MIDVVHKYETGLCCSKLTASLVNEALNVQTYNTKKKNGTIFCRKKNAFSAKHRTAIDL